VRTPAGAGPPETILRHVADGEFENILTKLNNTRTLTFLKRLRLGAASPELLPLATPHLAAPETIVAPPQHNNILFSTTLDVYTFGLVFYTILTDRLPYDHIHRPKDLRDTNLINELKLRETRGKVSPIETTILDNIPLHNITFCTPTN